MLVIFYVRISCPIAVADPSKGRPSLCCALVRSRVVRGHRRSRYIIVFVVASSRHQRRCGGCELLVAQVSAAMAPIGAFAGPLLCHLFASWLAFLLFSIPLLHPPYLFLIRHSLCVV